MKINEKFGGYPFLGIPPQILRIMKLTTLIMVVSLMQVSALTKAQITLNEKETTLQKVLETISKQSGYDLVYSNLDFKNTKPVTVKLNNASIEKALQIALEGQPLIYEVSGKTVMIKKKDAPSFLERVAERWAGMDVSGRVVDADGRGLSGASVAVKATGRSVKTNENGEFILKNVEEKSLLVISYIGYKVKTVTASKDLGNIRMEIEEENLKEVTINTGLFERKAESFTGAVSKFSGAELKQVSNQNLLKSLAILDPSFQMVEDLESGSNPNRLPEVVLRGGSSIPDLNSEYQNAPNLPLFILDGFETTVQKIYDLNMNLVASVTLLKDASAKAIYGSKAGNGVVVIETLQPVAGNLRISYSASMNLTMPDLSSYDMTNSMQKIQAEVLADKYVSPYPELQYQLTKQYAANLQQALSGVDTYWLSQPLRNGIGQNHSLNLDGGDEAMRYSANLSYNNIAEVMKGSDRTTISGGLTLSYNKKNFSFRNTLSVDQNKGNNSPYGDFSDYTKMNPYWSIYDDKGKLIPSYQDNKIFNPLYDASLNTKNDSQYLTVTENFYTEWQAFKNFKLSGRAGINLSNNSTELFLPANDTKFSNIPPTSEQYLDRGEYTVTNGKSNNVNGNLTAAYSFLFGKSLVYANVISEINQQISRSNGMTMVGFPNDKMDDISFGKEFQPGGKASGSENTTRDIGIASAVNYSYDDRYLADFTYRTNASTQFGANQRWGGFWSAGLGWNMHNETFMKSVDFINQFKIRGSMGLSGTQNFNSYQSISTYEYITDRTYNGDLGLQLLALSNPNLKWQQVLDKNIGTDIALFKRLNITFDYYIKDTKDLLAAQTAAPSTGFPSYIENVGEVRNQGFQLSGRLMIVSDLKNRTNVSVFCNVAHNTNMMRKVSSALKKMNEDQDNLLIGDSDNPPRTKPVTRFAEGQSMSAIWGVPSKGIDPVNGKEIFVKRDGSLTYVWSPLDQVVIGDTNPKYNGTFGTNIQLKNFTASFAFRFNVGGQIYNSTLIDKVENADINYNVDVRLLEGRWKTPGQQSFYKDIKDIEPTRPTSRFVENRDELIFSSVNIGYDLSRLKFVKYLKMNYLNVNVNMNDLGIISTVKTERGLDYPYSRIMSLSLNANF